MAIKPKENICKAYEPVAKEPFIDDGGSVEKLNQALEKGSTPEADEALKGIFAQNRLRLR